MPHRLLPPSFNSMKVRLKPMLSFWIYARSFCFNSMKVRLKPVSAGASLLSGMFQFHEGPIKTRVRDR